MNIIALRAFLSFSLLALAHLAIGQGGNQAFEPAPAFAVAKMPTTGTVSQTSRFHKKFPQLYTGMAIEVATSTYPMDYTAPVFKQFGNVYYEKLPEGGYSYLIMASFSSKESALDFVNNTIKPRAEKARLIQFTEGTRKVIRD